AGLMVSNFLEPSTHSPLIRRRPGDTRALVAAIIVEYRCGASLRLDGRGRPSPHEHYLALNSAGRFSTYAARPSFASSLWKSNFWFSRSRASAASNGISQPVCTARLL